MKIQWQHAAIAAGAVAVVVLVLNRAAGGRAAQGLGYAIGSTAADTVVGTIQGAVNGTVQGGGELIGLPRTDTPEAAVKLRRAMDDGDTLNVSLYAPAGTFIKWLWQGKPTAANFRE